MLQTMKPNRGMNQHMIPTSLHGVKVLITGCTNGLGLATAEKFAQKGAHLIVAGRDRAKCLQVIDQLKHYYPDESYDDVGGGGDDTIIDACDKTPAPISPHPSNNEKDNVDGANDSSDSKSKINDNCQSDINTSHSDSSGNDQQKKSLEYFPLDLSSFDSIRRFAQLYQSRYDELNVLICNAGVLVPERKLSVDGHELTFATNHLGHFLLTHLMLSCLRKAGGGAGGSNNSSQNNEDNVDNGIAASDGAHGSHASSSATTAEKPSSRTRSPFGPSRVIVISSVMHTTGSLSNVINDPNVTTRAYSSVGSTEYADSKLANLLFAYELNRQLRARNDPINVYAVHPGTMATGLFNEMNNGAMGYIMNPIKNIFFTDPEVSAQSIFRLGASDSFASHTGLYYSGVNVISSSNDSMNHDAQQKLWHYSEVACQLLSSESSSTATVSKL